MKLSGLYEISPLETALKRNLGGYYLTRQTNRAKKVPPKPQSNLMGGNYGARLSPRHKKYFGSLTSVRNER